MGSSDIPDPMSLAGPLVVKGATYAGCMIQKGAEAAWNNVSGAVMGLFGARRRAALKRRRRLMKHLSPRRPDAFDDLGEIGRMALVEGCGMALAGALEGPVGEKEGDLLWNNGGYVCLVEAAATECSNGLTAIGWPPY